jgi:uncharacterized protein (TIGR00251 family)
LAACYRQEQAGLRLFVRLTPRSSCDAIEGVATLDNGREVLKVKVRAVPEKGKANAALIKLVAKKLDVARSGVTIASGATARLKSLRIEGDATVLATRVKALTGSGI